ncbi:hypothetical protein C0995_013017 [Termitomyces sp. Mi166|nr:hypothetical protein C0995_013017 [Termitomyces sp. Mi166\
MILPREILDEIASGALVPSAESLEISTSGPGLFLATIHHRLERELASGSTVRLQKLAGCLPNMSFNMSDPRLAQDLSTLKNEYGSCSK